METFNPAAWVRQAIRAGIDPWVCIYPDGKRYTQFRVADLESVGRKLIEATHDRKQLKAIAAEVERQGRFFLATIPSPTQQREAREVLTA